MSFKYPIFFIAILFAAPFIWKRYKTKAINFPSIKQLKKINPGLRARLRDPILKGLASLLLLLLSLAAARPYSSQVLRQPSQARNLMLALDISGSMQTGDYFLNNRAVSRLTAVKAVVDDFIKDRKNDRLGLIAFGTDAYLECPLTLDHQLLGKFVDQLQIGIAGRGTAIGDGLGLSVKRVASVPGKSKAIILLTDGVNTSGNVDPIQAAKVAQELDIKIHTIGIGSPSTIEGIPQGSSRQTFKALEFDEKLLKQVAEITGGVYFNAQSLEDLKTVYQEIDLLEKSDQKEPERQILNEKNSYFVLWALVGYFLISLLANGPFMRVP